MEKLMDTVLKLFQMELSMMDSGLMGNLKTGNALIQTERFMKVNGLTENRQVRELKLGQMEDSMTGYGKLANQLELDLKYTLMEGRNKDIGIKENS